MSSMSPSWLVFDLGNVVIRLQRPYAPAFIAGTSEEERTTLRQLLKDDFQANQKEFSLCERYQLGLVTTADFLHALGSTIKWRMSTEQIEKELNSLLVEQISSTVAAIEELKGKYRLACLSNTHEIHWKYLLQTFPVMRRFEKHFASFQLGVAKPERQCFQLLCNELGEQPDRCLLIDDREANVHGARAAGLQALLVSPDGDIAQRIRDHLAA